MLHRLGHGVDDDAADGDQRRGGGAGQDGHDLGHRERDGGRDDAGERPLAARGCHALKSPARAAVRGSGGGLRGDDAGGGTVPRWCG
jgi:hypothetical protein